MRQAAGFDGLAGEFGQVAKGAGLLDHVGLRFGPECFDLLLDWHSAPKDLYAIDMKNTHGRELSDEEIDQLHQELLLEVEAVQLEQMALLRCLIKHHGLKRIYSEGLTPNGLADYKERVDVLRKMEKDQIPELVKQLADVREMLKAMKPESERYQQAQKIEAEITGMLDQHKVRLLEIGSPGRLLVAGEIEAVMPLEDADPLSQAKTITQPVPCPSPTPTA